LLQNKVTTTNTTQHISENEKGPQVQYIKREKIYETVEISRNFGVKSHTEDFNYSYEFFKVGKITSGKYKDGDLILALITADGACKGPGCGKPFRFRYVKKGNVVTFFPRMSIPIGFIAEDDSLTKTNPFQKFNLSLNVDKEFSIPILEYTKKITNTSRQNLQLPEYNVEEDGELDRTKLYKVFNNDFFGDIYTSKSEFSPRISFDIESRGWGPSDSVQGCRGSSCFTTNAFFLFRPDGTFLKYVYTPDFLINDVRMNDSTSVEDDYVFNTIAGCSNETLDHMSVVSPSIVTEHDMSIVGKNSKGDSIYELKNKEDKLYAEFYNNYKKYFAGPYGPEDTKIQPYAEFINAKPILLWYDPFGRLIRFNNQEFLPPHFCEPIIYLYPESTQQVKVTLNDSIKITDASPHYLNGWDVIAKPTGELLTLTNNQKYPYLFWEGWSYNFPIQKKGFVVKKSEVRDFFDRTLPKFGLNKKEKSDFVQAWLPRFMGSPYYFITFIDKSTIDALAPIEINPRPDTTIRVLMDYKPLDKPIDVEELQITEPPLRKGFTVIEWGGLQR
jgi:hypothetical protein